MYFSRLTLTNLEPHKLKRLMLEPYALHQEIWGLFADEPQRQRDFLYRLEENRSNLLRFYALSERPPIAKNAQWFIESKTFAPVLQKGQWFEFQLRVNPVRRMKSPEGRSCRIDIVDYYNLHLTQEDKKCLSREEKAYQASQEWFQEQGEKNGFVVKDIFRVENYQKKKLKKGKKNHSITLTMMDFSGVIELTEPEVFRKVLYQGIGHGRSFGCGLFLIKRRHSL